MPSFINALPDEGAAETVGRCKRLSSQCRPYTTNPVAMDFPGTVSDKALIPGSPRPSHPSPAYVMLLEKDVKE